MRKILIGAGLAAAVAAGMFVQAERASAAAKKVRTYFAVLTPGQEPTVEPTSTGSGVAFLTFDESSGLLSYSYSVTTTGTITAAHIHGPGQPGVDASVLFTVNAARAGNGVTPRALSKTEVKDLNRGLFYLNVHTDTAVGGEIRGQIMPLATTYKPLP